MDSWCPGARKCRRMTARDAAGLARNGYYTVGQAMVSRYSCTGDNLLAKPNRRAGSPVQRSARTGCGARRAEGHGTRHDRGRSRLVPPIHRRCSPSPLGLWRKRRLSSSSMPPGPWHKPPDRDERGINDERPQDGGVGWRDHAANARGQPPADEPGCERKGGMTR
jgi:hypothetical protein